MYPLAPTNGQAEPWLARLRDQARPYGLLKSAEPATGSSETQFEEAMSNLAHTYLRDKAPGLMPYEVGFQLIDKNDDNTKAVGITAFQVGKQWLYAPVFFLSGELKGHDILYLKNQDTCVPLRENWLNDILNKKPRTLGNAVDRNSANLGMQPPDLMAFSRSPSTYSKMGMAPGFREADFLPGKAALAHMALGHWAKEARFQSPLTLEAFLRTDPRFVEALAAQLQQSVKLASAFRSLYGDPLAFLKRAREEHACLETPLPPGRGVLSAPRPDWAATPAERRAPRPAPGSGVLGNKSGSVTIITLAMARARREQDGDDGLSPEERETLQEEGSLVEDGRGDSEVSTAYELPVRVEAPSTLTNPNETGVYDVLVKPARFVRCTILMQPYGPRGRQDFCIVIPQDSPGCWLNADSSAVWVHTPNKDGTPSDEFLDWKEALPSADELTAKDGTFLVVGPGRQSTVAFQILRSQTSSQSDQKAFRIQADDYVRCDAQRPGYLPERGEPGRHVGGPYLRDQPAQPALRLTGKDSTRLTIQDGEIWVPKGCKLLKLEGEQGDGFPLGNDQDVSSLIFQKTAGLVVQGSHGVYQFQDARGALFDKVAALSRLVLGHGLRAVDAREILAKVDQVGHGRYRIKRAAGYPEGFPGMGPGPDAPAVPEPTTHSDPYTPGVMGQSPEEHEARVATPPGDPNAYSPTRSEPAYPMPDAGSQKVLSEAAQSGQKEVFDTSMIGSLLHTVGDDLMIDRHLGDLMTGLDRIGRILISFYWNRDQFAERFGEADMPELEDHLRTNFKGMGDLVLKLKQKAVEPFPDELSAADLEGGS